MNEFEVTIQEQLSKTIKIEANDREEAEAMVKEQWNKGEIVLGGDDFIDVDFITDVGKEKLIDALLIKPMQEPQIIKLHYDLDSLQNAVGGMIECVDIFEDPVVILCNEEAKIFQLPANRGIFDKKDVLKDVICGDFLIVGDGDEQFESLTKEQLEKYAKLYQSPEKFYRMAGKIIVEKVHPKKPKELNKKQNYEL